MKVDITQTMTDLKAQLMTLYGSRLHGVYLFGSYARQEADEESDADVIIVLDRVDDYSKEIKRTSELVSMLSLKSGVSISRVFASESRWLEDQTLFFMNIREEALPV